MKQILLILILFSSITVSGQNRELHIKSIKDGSTSFWYEWRTELCAQIDLDSVQNSEDSWHFRLWTDKQAIDIWKELDGRTFSKVTSWANEYTPNNEEQTNRIFSENKLLVSEKTNELIKLIDSTQIKNIPDEDYIQNWSKGLDGITYSIETADSSDYFFKNYWTPSAQDSLIDAIVVQNFVDSCLKITDSKEIWSDFASRIPFECYSNGGPIVACRGVTEKERRKFKKERKNYRQQKR